MTLIELLVVVAIAAIMLAMAAPALGLFVENAQIDQTSGMLLSSFNYARNKAIDLGVTVGVCPVAGAALAGGSAGTTCLGQFQPGAGTSASWMVYRFKPGSQTIVPMALYNAPASYGLGLHPAGFSSLQGLSFSPIGTVNASGQIAICDRRGNAAGAMVAVAANGMVSVSPSRGEDAYGQPLSACP